MSSRQIFHIIFRRIVLAGGSSDLVGTVPDYFPADCFGGSSDLAGTTTKKPTQPHNCTGSDLVGTGSTLFSGGLFWRQLRYGGNNNKKMTTVMYTKYMLIKTDTTAQLEQRFLQPTQSKCMCLSVCDSVCKGQERDVE